MSSTSGSFPLPPAGPQGFAPATHTTAPVWPLRPEYLADATLCPACFTPLSSSTRSIDGSPGPVCASCGLDLSGAEAAAIFTAGSEIVSTELRRQSLLATLRSSQAQRTAAHASRLAADVAAAAAPPAPTTPAASAPAAVPALVSTPVHPGPPAPYPATTDAGRPRRSGIQILMLTVGIILVSIMAIFFVLLAYVFASLEVRSVLTGIASVAVFGTAMLLHRRRLFGTAEGIAVLAIVLLLLDVWIVRANDLFGSAALNGWLYTGIATGVLATALTAGFRVLPLRSLSITAAILLPFSVFSLALGVLTDVDPAIRAWAAFAAVGFATLSWQWIPLAGLERGIVRFSGLGATAIALLPGSVAFTDVAAGPAIALAVLAAIWFGHLSLSPLRPTPSTDAGPAEGTPNSEQPLSRTTPWHLVAAIGLGLTVAAVGPALFFRAPDAEGILWIPGVATAIGAVVLGVTTRLSGRSPGAPLLSIATAIPLALAPLLVAPAAVLALSQVVALTFIRPFSVRVDGALPLDTPDLGWAGPLALLAVSLLGASALLLLGRLTRLGWIPAAIGVIGLTAASLALQTPVLTALGFLVIATAAVGATASRRIPRSYRAVAAFASALSIFGLFVAGLTNTTTFPITALAALALLVILHTVVRGAAPSRVALRHGAAPAAILASAAVVLLGTVPLVPFWFQTVTGTTAAQAAPALLTALTALVILLAIPFCVTLCARVESATVAVVAALALGSALAPLALRIPVDATPFLVTSGGVVVTALLWQFVRPVAAWPERYVAAILAPLGALWFGSVLCDQIDPSATLTVGAGAIVLLTAVALLMFRAPIEAPAGAAQQIPHPMHAARIARICWDGAIAVASVAVIVQAFTSGTWVVLLLLTVATLIIASGEGGVIAGHTPRRHVAWVGLPLAISALWLALATNNVEVVEYYTLPVAGLLLGILALILLRHTPAANCPSSPRTTLFGAALGLAILPSAVTFGVGDPLRTVLTLVAASALLVAGPFSPALWRGVRVAVVVWLAGATSSLVLVLASAQSGPNGASGWEHNVAAAALLAGGALWVLRRQAPRLLGTLAAAAAPIVVALPIAESILDSATPFWEFLLVLVLASALYVITSVGPFRSEIVRWTALGAAVVVAATAMTTGLADPFETATVPIAAALLTAGAVRLASEPASRSWTHLGIGIAVLLVPSLLADVTGTDLVRVVALGVAALAVFGVGLALKLGAPTILGASVLVIHALAQLWPWISGLYGAIPWWLWGGVGGVILIVFAATYEKRIRDLRSVSRSIASLR